MKTIIQIITVSLLLSSCKSTSQRIISYHPMVQKAKQTSLYTENVDWEKVNAKFIELALDTTDSKDELQYLINSLEDKHATFRLSSDQSIVVSYNGTVDHSDTRNPKFVNEIINDISSKFEYRELDGQIGYLKVVGIAPGQVDENAKLIRDGLIDLKQKGVNQWIVDLRYHGGGDMNPMISGLVPLIGEGFIGGSVNNKNEILYEYRIDNGQFYANDRLVA